jgi:NAD(P)-dependent dehydrogenase (short-subunit alcohol dehydrogenase family)
VTAQQQAAPGHTDLSGAVLFVTGGAQGIGRAIAAQAAARGARVVVADIDDAKANETVERIAADGGVASFRRCDVTDADDIVAAVDHVVDLHGRIDAAVNNAGIVGPITPTRDYPLESFDRVVALNLRGVFACMQAELRHMLPQRQGAIVNVSSVAGFRGFANFSAYNASKHGVVGLTRTAAVEVATSGVRINSVAPGFCETPMVMEQGLKAERGTDAHRQIAQLHPMDRLGDPAEIARAALWLCTEAASFVTGHNLAVDGGLLAQ